MFDRALNPLMCMNCLINDKDILRLGKLIDNEDKYEVSKKLASVDFDSWHYGQHCQMPT